MSELLVETLAFKEDSNLGESNRREIDDTEARKAKLDAVLTALVGANADVVIKCPWLGDAEVTLSEAMRAYPRPMIDEDPYELANIVMDLLSNRVDVSKDDEPETMSENSDETDTRVEEVVKNEEAAKTENKETSPTNSIEQRSSSTKTQEAQTLKISGGAKEESAESRQEPAADQAELSNIESHTTDDSKAKATKSVMSEEGLDITEPSDQPENAKTVTEAKGILVTESGADLVKDSEGFGLVKLQSNQEDLNLENDIDQLFESGKDEVSGPPLEETTRELDMLEIEQDLRLAKPDAQLEAYETEGLENRFEDDEAVEEIKISLIELYEQIENAEPEVAVVLEIGLGKVAEIAAKVEVSSDQANETEVEEELEELFIELFESLNIEHTPELIDSLVSLTFRLHFADKISQTEEDDTPDQAINIGTHEVIKRLLARSNTVQRSRLYAGKIGKSVLQLYDNSTLVDGWTNG